MYFAPYRLLAIIKLKIAMNKKTLREVIAHNIRKYRKQKGLSQEKLSILGDFHHAYIGCVERSVYNLSVDSLERIAKTLDVEEMKLLDRNTGDE